MTGEPLPPLPPPHLALRTGVTDRDEPLVSFDQAGHHVRQLILDLLGPEWDFTDKQVLDFGCGAGKLLRHMLGEARSATFRGCDIDEPSIAWLRETMSPPVHVFVNDPLPPLPLESASLDLITAMSVFTHLAAEWSAWLVELHRLLKPQGLLIASFLGRGMSDKVSNEPWAEHMVGMNVLEYGRPWALGGSDVLLSPWWIKAHWGRAFEIVKLVDLEDGQGLLLLRKRDRAVTPVDLELPEPNEPRELLALTGQLRQVQQELASVRFARQAEPADVPVRTALQVLTRALRRRYSRSRAQ